MRVIEILKGLNFKLFILAILSNVMVIAQTATDPLTNTYAVVDNVNSNKMFFGQNSSASCCGNQDPDGTLRRVIVTYEALNLTLTQTIIDQLKGSTSHYTDGATGYDLFEYNGVLLLEMW